MNFNHDTGTIDTFQSIDVTSLPPLGGTVNVLTIIGSGAVQLTVGTTLQRPTGALGMVRANSDLSIYEGFTGGVWVDLTKQGTVTSVAAVGSTGLAVTGSPITSAGTLTFTLGAELQALAGVSATGIIVRTGTGTYTPRVITGTAGNIVIANGDGIAGNPTINLAAIGAGGTSGDATHTSAVTYDIFGRVTSLVSTAITFPVTSVFGRTGVVSAIAGDYTLAQIGTVALASVTSGQILTYNGTSWINAAPASNGTVTSIAVTGSTGLAVTGSPITSSGTINITLASELQGLAGLGTNGFVTRTGAGTYTNRSILGTAGTIVVTNGDGVAGAPTITLAALTAGAGGTFQKFTTDGFGRVSAVNPVTTSDITALVDATYVNVTGDTMSGNLIMTGGSTVTGLPTPVNPNDAAPKSYVDNAVTGLSWKQAVRAATVVAGTLATSFAAGSVLDGITLVAGDRILIKNQATTTENGIYVVNATGAPTRSIDSDTGPELVGESVFVNTGTANANTGWVQTTASPITIGTSPILYSQFSGAGSYAAGTGLTLTGNTFALTSPVSTGLGGTGLNAIGTTNQLLGVNAGATGLEYKTLVAGTGLSITPSAGTLALNNTGVTSVALALPSFLTVAGSPVTTTGTLSATLAVQAASAVLIAPVAGGVPTFRSISYADLPIKLYAESTGTIIAPAATGTNNSVAIGSGATASGAGAVAVGAGSLANQFGVQAYANGNFAAAGDAQSIQAVLRNLTTTATTTELFLDGTTATQRLVVPINGSWTFSILVTARRTDATGGSSGYKFEGVIRKDTTAASTTFTGSPAKSVLGETNSNWDCSVTADTINGALKVAVTGEAAKTIRWVATVNITQVTN